uniref:Cathepsin L-like n=1 Tax=Tetracapsuloides bryosalmonae TaxID=271932 RepID=A0A859IQK1_9CNID|nr:cathepsin L-like [Tetracapsuloides bryosalmonae]
MILVTISLLLFNANKLNGAYVCTDEYTRLLKAHSLPHDEKKQKVFLENCNLINHHNSLVSTNDANALVLEPNYFAFMTDAEYKSHLKYKVSKTVSQGNMKNCTSKRSSINWVEENAVLPIKNQGQCGSCWAFSATGAIESAYFIKNKKLIKLSEQELVDCCTNSSKGCSGGEMNDAFQYAIKNGLHENIDYPYKAEDQECKKIHANSTKVYIKKYCEVPTGKSQCLFSAIERGPTSIAIDASNYKFRFYKNGIFRCSGTPDLDHGVIAVGFYKGLFNFNSYYLVRNSWGTSWGLNGYIKISASDSKSCGATLSASFPLFGNDNC